MRIAPTAALAAVLLTACIGAGNRDQRATPAADLILINGKVLTVDARNTIAEAVAVQGERIVAVGTSAEIRRRAGPSSRIVDLRGRTLIPGLIDSHLHNAGGGPGVDLSGARSIAELLAAVAERAKGAPAGALIVSNPDWHEAQLKEQRLPHRRELDRVAPANPVVLIRGGHSFIVNSAALTRWNITRDTPVPAGGSMGRDPDGELDGELVNSARARVELPPPPRLVASEIVRQMKLLNAVGITSIRVPGSFQFGGDPVVAYRFFEELKRARELTLRVNYLFLVRDFASPERVRDTIASWGIRPDEGDEWLRVGGIKTGVDGGFEGGHMRAPYAPPFDRNGSYRGLVLIPPAAYVAGIRELNRLGWRVATHAVGDAAIDQVLEAYEAAHRDRSIKERLWVIEHAFIARADHFPRMRALGLAVSAQDHLYLAAPSMKKLWGPERAARVTPMRSFLDQELLVAAGTDAPVVPYSPFWSMYHFITRDTISDGVYGPSERITREEALRAYTLNGAKLTFEEAIKGSIEPGKLADLVVLSEDFLAAPEKALASMRALATWVGGREVYRSGDF